MNKYMKYSTEIYNIYLKYFSSDDIYVYSIDEVFIDVTHYLQTYQMKASTLATKVIQEVYETTGITATCGVGTNLYLSKIAMDIVAKHVKPNKYGVRIACLDENMYKKQLWNHRPLTDFWRVGKGIAKKLEQNNMHTMGDVARCSINNEDKLFKLFGINAELLIDHAWGYEPCTMQSIKSYVPTINSISSGQVLHCPYNYEKTKLIIKEMTELLVLDLVDRNLVTNQIVLTVGYDIDNLTNKNIDYKGEVTIDRYGRSVPKHAHGTINLDHKTSSNKIIGEAVMELYDRIIDNRLLTRRINVTANNVVNEEQAEKENNFEQIDLFTNYQELEIKQEKEKKERDLQKSILDIKRKYRPKSKYPQMSLYQRSAQFAPFAALTGYEGQVKETARLTDKRIELDEEIKVKLDMKIQVINEFLSSNPEVEITYFIPDSKKDGGRYETIKNCVKKIDNYNEQIVMQSGLKIEIKEIIEITGEIFKNINF